MSQLLEEKNTSAMPLLNCEEAERVNEDVHSTECEQESVMEALPRGGMGEDLDLECLEEGGTSLAAEAGSTERDNGHLAKQESCSTNLHLPLGIYTLHLVLFGSGRHRLWPCITVGVSISLITFWSIGEFGCAFERQNGTFASADCRGIGSNHKLKARQVAWLWIGVSNAVQGVECLVNAFFGFKLCKDLHVEKLILWILKHSNIDKASLSRSLIIVGWIGWFLALLLSSCRLIEQLTVTEHFTTANVTSQLLTNILMGLFVDQPVMYLCVLWLWINWVIHTAAEDIAEHIVTCENVQSNQASVVLIDLLLQMKTVSQYWSANHAARLVCTLLWATSEVLIFITSFDSSLTRGWFQWSYAAGLYLVVWFTAVAPGYVSDRLYYTVHQKLACVAHETEPQGSSSDDTAGSGICLVSRQRLLTASNEGLCGNATLLMQRMQILRSSSRMGMFFAGVPMTMQKAVSVGSLIMYLVITAVRSSTEFTKLV
jgi:hypothetical protein